MEARSQSPSPRGGEMADDVEMKLKPPSGHRSTSRSLSPEAAAQHDVAKVDSSRKRSASPRRSRSYSTRSRNRRNVDVETIEIADEDASFILGAGGRTKRKLSRVCGAELNITERDGKTVLEIKGLAPMRAKARLYVSYVMQQRVGPVTLNFKPSEREDLTCIEVPHDCVGYVTGRRGMGLRSIEEEWSTLMFFTDLRSTNSGESERLAIFGATPRARRGAELKVMSAVEQKIAGHFTKDLVDTVSEEEGFATDTMPINEDDYSYALGREGSTRKKLARASGAILEYVGRMAFIVGDKAQRRRAREYLTWLCAQRTTSVSVKTDGRDDCTVVNVPINCVAYVTGTKGNALRRVEEQTGTFIFLDGDHGRGNERLLIFGESLSGRKRAKDLIEVRIDEKLSGRSSRGRDDYGSFHRSDSYSDRRRGRSRDRERRRSRSRGDRHDSVDKRRNDDRRRTDYDNRRDRDERSRRRDRSDSRTHRYHSPDRRYRR